MSEDRKLSQITKYTDVDCDEFARVFYKLVEPYHFLYPEKGPYYLSPFGTGKGEIKQWHLRYLFIGKPHPYYCRKYYLTLQELFQRINKTDDNKEDMDYISLCIEKYGEYCKPVYESKTKDLPDEVFTAEAIGKYYFELKFENINPFCFAASLEHFITGTFREKNIEIRTSEESEPLTYMITFENAKKWWMEKSAVKANLLWLIINKAYSEYRDKFDYNAHNVIVGEYKDLMYYISILKKECNDQTFIKGKYTCIVDRYQIENVNKTEGGWI